MASALVELWLRNRRLFTILRQLPPSLLLKRAGASIKRRLRPLSVYISRSAIVEAVLSIVDSLLGTSLGNRFFWKVRLARNLASVERRIFRLTEAGQVTALRGFVEGALLHSSEASVLMLLARSGLTCGILSEYLRDESLLDRISAKLPRSGKFSAGLAAAAALLLEPADLARVDNLFKKGRLRLAPEHSRLVDSFATVPSARPSALTGTVATAPSRQPARHRLIIANNFNNPTRLSLMFAGAEKVTLFSPSNLYGRLTLDDSIRLHARPDQILTAHPRSRVTRFSAAYHRLHEETRLIAEEIIDEIDREAEGHLAEAKPYLALHLADALFFKALPIVGLRELVADKDVDQVVVARCDDIHGKLGDDDDPGDSFLQFLSGISGLQEDPRVEFVSLANRDRTRAKFASGLAQAFYPEEPPRQTIPASVRPLSDGLFRLRLEAQEMADAMQLWPKASSSTVGADRPPRVLFITRPDSAYNTSSAVYADILLRNFDTLIGLVEQNAAAIFNSVPNLPIPDPARVQLMPKPRRVSNFAMLDHSLQHILERVAQQHSGKAEYAVTAHLLRKDCAHLSQATILVGLFHWERLLHWFAYMSKAGQRPDVLAISPLRPPLVGMAAAVARRFSIPSIALEPHTINAEYCRYTRVMTDRYATVSSYLAALTEKGFSISADRIDVIGSPRLIAKPAVAPHAARRALEEARKARFPQDRQTLVFFSQPSNWEQISEVWQMILSAMAPHESMQILLKTHPEEGDLRVTSYLAIAESLGLGDRVQFVTAPSTQLIEAADLVLACYSATLVEAALAGRPVYSVVNKGVRYPIDQHEVVGAPQYDDVATLSEALGAFCRDPSASLARLAQFMKSNPQLIEGPETHLCAAIVAMTKADSRDVLRPAEDLPPRLFIEGPYRTYNI